MTNINSTLIFPASFSITENGLTYMRVLIVSAVRASSAKVNTAAISDEDFPFKTR